MELICKQQNNDNIVDVYYHYIWFIDSEDIFFILILKEKTTSF